MPSILSDNPILSALHILIHLTLIQLNKGSTIITSILQMRKLRKSLSSSLLKDLTIPSAGKDTEQLALSYIAGGNAKWYSHLRKSFGSFLKVNIHLPYDTTYSIIY